MIQVLEKSNDTSNPGTMRLKGRAMSDNLEGWITVKGSAGTVFAAPSQHQALVLQETALLRSAPTTAGANSGASEEVCTLAKDDVVNFDETPIEEAAPPVTRVKV